MTDSTFRALVITEHPEKAFKRTIEERRISDLPEGEVLVRVHYSSLNYKDGLSSIGNRGVTRKYPHTPGIDASGIVESSASDAFKFGDEVIVTSYDLGMNTSGGYGQYIRVPAAWVVPLPEGLTLKEAMAYGTAGYTAALAVDALLKNGITPEQGGVVVTGSTGGVGSVSVALLAKLGFEVTAATGKPDEAAFLKMLGASGIVSREDVNDESGKPILKPQWIGAVDTVGGATLATLLKSLDRGGAAAATGLVASPDLPTSVFPFILRGVSLLGIDSGETPMALRQAIWGRLAGDWKLPQLNALMVDCTLDTLGPEIDKILKGQQRGRVVVDLES
jgi:putative YhdH/YhfP family quinone oxidoreductase